MAATSSYDSLRLELQNRGLIGPSSLIPLEGGNRDRADRSRVVLRTDLPDGSPAKIRLGRDLGDVARRTRAFAQAFPSLESIPVFHVQIEGLHLLGERFVEGISLRSALLERLLPPAIVHRAFAQAVITLRATATPSNEVNRSAEWNQWSEQICALGVWKSADLTFLRDNLLPKLASHLLVGRPEVKWVHGDFTDENVLLDSQGAAHLIDAEFAHQTHFFHAEAAHFYALSSSARQQPGFFNAVLERPSAAWFLYFWLTQISREIAVNTAEYVARWLPARLRILTLLSDELLGEKNACPWQRSEETTFHKSETLQFFWPNSEGPVWTEKSSLRLSYQTGTTQTLFVPVEGRHSLWRIDPSTSPEQTCVHRITARSHDYAEIATIAGLQFKTGAVSGLQDTSIEWSSTGLSVHAPSGDPQFSFQFPVTPEDPPIAWFEVEMRTANRTEGNRPVRVPAFCIEESRWLDLAPTFFRVGGWYIDFESPRLVKFHAVLRGQILAASEVLPRSDVQAHFQNTPHALESGFQLDLPSQAAGWTVELMAKTAEGTEIIFHSLLVGRPPNRPVMTADYSHWADVHDPDPPASAVILTPGALFSILLPVYNPNPTFLEQCLASVQRQHFPQWELCIVDDASDHSIARLLQEHPLRADPRVKLVRRSTNGGIARATNDALSQATGRYIVFLDHDDLLRPHALAEFASRLGQEPDLDALYSDEDKIDAQGIRRAPLLKPDYSPEFALGVMYLGHALCVRASLARTLGGFDSTYDGIQDYEFFLRLTEKTSRIGHIPRMLYHWRMSPSSSAMTGNVKGNMDLLQVRAVQAHLDRTHRNAMAVSLGGHRVQLQPPQTPLSSRCVILAGERIDPAALCSGVETIADIRDHVSLLHAANQVKTPFVVVVTTNLIPATPNWLETLLIFAECHGVGAVGPLLLENESIVASAGLSLTRTGQVIPLMKGFARDADGYNGSLKCTREVLAVSGACLVIRRDLLLSLADAITAFPQIEWAINLCLALQMRGQRNLICPHAALQLSAAPTSEISPNISVDPRLLLKSSPAFDRRDPYYPALFDPETGDYRLRTDGTADFFSDTFKTFIDAPTNFELRGNYLRMRGWSFSTRVRFQHVRLVVNDVALSGRYGTERPDVIKIFTSAPETKVGFELWAIIPTGRHIASLEFQDTEKIWHRTATIKITTRASRPLWVPGSLAEDLVHFQLGARPTHAPRPLEPESFPRAQPPGAAPLRVSIVTPSYNQRRYLDETMASVLSQNVEIDYVVRDGGSTDGSVDLIRKYAPQLKHWESAKDLGQADAIAKGFTATSGRPRDLMAWINSDDSYLPGALTYVADYFIRHPDVDVVYGHRILIDENSAEIGRWFLPRHDEEMLRLNDYVPQETMFWRRRIWDKVGGIDPSFKFALDWDLLLRFQAAGAKIVRLPYFLACFRIHSAQKTSAQMESVGQKEIDALRLRTFGRVLTPQEIETHPRLIRYLRKSAWIEFLWRRLHIRHP